MNPRDRATFAIVVSGMIEADPGLDKEIKSAACLYPISINNSVSENGQPVEKRTIFIDESRKLGEYLSREGGHDTTTLKTAKGLCELVTTMYKESAASNGWE